LDHDRPVALQEKEPSRDPTLFRGGGNEGESKRFDAKKKAGAHRDHAGRTAGFLGTNQEKGPQKLTWRAI